MRPVTRRWDPYKVIGMKRRGQDENKIKTSLSRPGSNKAKGRGLAV